MFSLLWISRAGSSLFPGVQGVEAEFPEKAPKIKGVRLNEWLAGALMLALLALGYSIERGRRA